MFPKLLINNALFPNTYITRSVYYKPEMPAFCSPLRASSFLSLFRCSSLGFRVLLSQTSYVREQTKP